MSPTSKKVLLVIYLAALAAFGPFSTDIYLASMPIIQHIFNTSIAQVQLTLSLFFISFAITQLFWGPLSDRIGRKPVIFIGIAVYVLASLCCAWSTTIVELIIARILQATGACAGVVMAMAIVRDKFPNNKELTKMLSTMTSVAILAPIIAPIIGSYLLHHINWQANFYFLSIYGTLLILGTFFIAESHPKIVRKPFPIKKLYRAYIKQITFNPFLLSVLAVSTNFSVLFSFISSSSFIYIEIYHSPVYLFGYLFAFNAIALTCGSFTLNKIKHKFSDKSIILMATTLATIGAIIMIVLLCNYPYSIWCVILPSFFVTYGVGILYPELTAQALQNVVDYTGLASSLLGASRFILAAITGFIMGILLSDSALPLAIAMLSFNTTTIIVMLIYFKRRKMINKEKP